MYLRNSLLFAAAASAVPLESAQYPNQSTTGGLKCGPVGNFFNPTLADWNQSNTDQFMDNWVKNHQPAIKSNKDGFASAFGQWAAGNPDFACRDDGSVGCTTDNVCGNRQMNSHGKQIAPAYYVMKSIEGLHAYFTGMSQAFEVSALLGALETDTWADTFYKKKDGHDADDTSDKSILIMKELFNVLVVVVGIGAAFVSGGAGIAAAAGIIGGGIAAGTGAAVGTVGVLAGGAVGAVNIAMSPPPSSNNFAHASDVANAIANVVKNGLENLITQNNDLMAGRTINSTGKGITDYLHGGFFINSTVDKVGAIETMGAMLQGMAVNRLWRENKIFIMGGAACGDNQGIGQGPQNYSWCDSQNRAWYLYFWQENDVISTTSHKWGWVTMPPGADKLGPGSLFPNLTVQDAIQSSVNSYNAGGFNYTADMMANRTISALQGLWADPRAQGPRWEGVFTLPVCDIGATVGSSFQDKEYILQDYGHDSRPVWCGAICGNSTDTTQKFIQAANMGGFQSPKHLCDNDPGY